MPTAQIGIYYKGTRFAVLAALTLRFLVFWGVAH
jgi:hypothetical protein